MDFNQLDRDVIYQTKVLVEEMHRQLFGNGSQGVIQKIDLNGQMLEVRVRGLEQFDSRVVGAVRILAGLISASGVGWLITTWRGHFK